MTMTDPIADMLTRIRNAIRIKRAKVDVPHSLLKESIAKVLKREGYIGDFQVVTDEGAKYAVVRIALKYDEDGAPAIQVLARESKPGRRQYRKHGELPKVLGGLGIGILSTPKGVLSDREARKEHVGGEFLCSVY